MANDHYVPKFLLKNWLKPVPKYSHPRLEILCKLTGRISFGGARRTHAVENYDGTGSQKSAHKLLLENIESSAGGAVKKVRNNEIISRGCWEKELSHLAALQVLRSPRYRHAMAISRRTGVPFDEVPLGLTIPGAESRDDAIPHAVLIDSLIAQYADKLLSYEKYLIAQDVRSFELGDFGISCDNGARNMNPSTDILEARMRIYLPITPSIAVAFVPKTIYLEEKKSLKELQNKRRSIVRRQVSGVNALNQVKVVKSVDASIRESETFLSRYTATRKVQFGTEAVKGFNTNQRVFAVSQVVLP